MIIIKCDFCGSDMEDTGALIFSPPSRVTVNKAVCQYNMCRDCYETLIANFIELKNNEVLLETIMEENYESKRTG